MKKITKIVDKPKGLFDHIKHIRQVQSINYYENLTESEKKTFNKFMILRLLSMDPSIIEEVSYLSKYMEVLPENKFYSVCISVFPKSRNFFPYIKSKKTKKFSDELLNLISIKYECSKNIAESYCDMLILTDKGMEELIKSIKSFGKSDEETEKLLAHE